MKRKWFAKVAWSIDDIKTERPDWSNEECRAFLDEIEDKLIDNMVAEGWQTMRDIFREKEV